MRKRFNRERILNLCEPGDFGIIAPPMKAQVALNELCSYLLGDDWYDTSGVTNPEQINTAIVCAIEQKFPGARIKPENVDEYRRQCCKIPFYELPVGAVCQLGNLRLKKISDHNVPGRISRCPSNAINLANDHHCTVLTSLWVLPIESAESKSEEEIISR